MLLPAGACAQDIGTVDPKPLPPLANPDDPNTPAKELFGRKAVPRTLETRALGWYAKGCLSGATALPVNGETWQVMRLSRNRNWGHPNLVTMIERLSEKGKKLGWNGLLVGDMSQPRGGPMLTGHASHQVGLDADIWLTPMPDRELTRQEREEMSAIRWSPAAARMSIRRSGRRNTPPSSRPPPNSRRWSASSSMRRSRRRSAAKPATSRAWLTKVRPYWGHDYPLPCAHPLSAGTGGFASRRIRCRQAMAAARNWTAGSPMRCCSRSLRRSRRSRNRRLKLADLPAACRQVLMAP